MSSCNILAAANLRLGNDLRQRRSPDRQRNGEAGGDRAIPAAPPAAWALLRPGSGISGDPGKSAWHAEPVGNEFFDLAHGFFDYRLVNKHSRAIRIGMQSHRREF